MLVKFCCEVLVIYYLVCLCLGLMRDVVLIVSGVMMFGF